MSTFDAITFDCKHRVAAPKVKIFKKQTTLNLKQT